MAIDIFGDDNLIVKVWNPSTKTVISTYDNYQEAGNTMCLTPKIVRSRCESKKQVYSPLHKMNVAVRLVAK